MRYLQAIGWAAAVLSVSVAGLADDRSTALMKEAQQATARATSLQADLVLVNGDTTLKGKLTLKRPNLARIEIRGSGMDQTIVSDGASVYTYTPEANAYEKEPAGASGENIAALWLHQVRGFYRWASLFPEIEGATTTYLGKRTLDGVAFEVVELSLPGVGQTKVKYFVSVSDRLVHRVEQSFLNEGEVTRVVAALKNVKLNPTTSATAFQWKAPANAGLVEAPDYEKTLLAVGKPAPDFDLDRPGGGRLALNQAIKDKKATLINFWFYG